MRELPKVTPLKLLSWCWTLFGLFLSVFGFLKCRSNSESSRIACDSTDCVVTMVRGGAVIEETAFPRVNLMSAELVRLYQGEIVDPTSLSRQKRRTTASSYAIKWLDAQRQTHMRPMSSRGLGRQVPRSRVQEIMKYIKREIHEVDVSQARYTSGVGLICCIFGVLLLLMRAAVGNLSSSGDGDGTAGGRSGGSSAQYRHRDVRKAG
ncbi:hypothetical protein JKP88DRAFT_242161 [Tribonema minus]|uniref:Transmembrane protein n=1 Tax=Tribonema minus TaxID=303371 RepID=A0A835YLB3_9STRA|nr:hypothetical protein JKP88DRAFT_242161 [Tribonema minus]